VKANLLLRLSLSSVFLFFLFQKSLTIYLTSDSPQPQTPTRGSMAVSLAPPSSLTDRNRAIMKGMRECLSSRLQNAVDHSLHPLQLDALRRVLFMLHKLHPSLTHCPPIVDLCCLFLHICSEQMTFVSVSRLLQISKDHSWGYFMKKKDKSSLTYRPSHLERSHTTLSDLSSSGPAPAPSSLSPSSAALPSTSSLSSSSSSSSGADNSDEMDFSFTHLSIHTPFPSTPLPVDQQMPFLPIHPSMDKAIHEGFIHFLSAFFPSLYVHLHRLRVDLSSITSVWFGRFFVSSLPYYAVLRICDMLFLYGGSVLLRVAVTLCFILEKRLQMCKTSAEVFRLIEKCKDEGVVVDSSSLLDLAFVSSTLQYRNAYRKESRGGTSASMYVIDKSDFPKEIQNPMFHRMVQIMTGGGTLPFALLKRFRTQSSSNIMSFTSKKTTFVKDASQTNEEEKEKDAPLSSPGCDDPTFNPRSGHSERFLSHCDMLIDHEQSEIDMSDDDVSRIWGPLYRWLPEVLHSCRPIVAFSAEQQGYQLRTLVRVCRGLKPIMILIRSQEEV
jgi:hypothetical protein